MDLRNALFVAWSDLKEAADAHLVKPGQSVLADGLGLVTRLSNYAWMKAETGSWFNNVARKIYYKAGEWQAVLKASSRKPSKVTHLKSDVRLLGFELGRAIKQRFFFAVDIISRAFGAKRQQIPAKPLPLPPLHKVAELKQNLAVLESEQPADRDAFNERIFQTSKDLYQLRCSLPKKDLAKNHPLRVELRRAEQRLEALNPRLPRVRDIVKANGNVKATLAETVNGLCEKGEMTAEDLQRDRTLFNLSSDQEVMALYAKRVVKAGRTGFHLSTVTGIERSWQKLKDTDEGVTLTFEESGEKRHVVFLPQEGEVYVKELSLKPGSFKVASLATSFFAVKKQDQRSQVAILQPLDDRLLEKEVQAEESPVSGSMVVYEEKEQPKLVDAANGMVAQERRRKEIERQDFVREANFCRDLGKLPGIWPTHKVCSVDGEIAIFQKAAGYRPADQERVIDLEGMQQLLNQGKLAQGEQKNYLDMLEGALEGIQSLHDKGIIHRDLKLANMLVSKDGRGFVSDLGTVVHKEGDLEKKIAIGSPSFMSPEVGILVHLKNDSAAWKEVDTKADIWSLGVILFELASGKESQEHPSILLTRDFSEDNVTRGSALLAAVNPDEIENDQDRLDAEKANILYREGYPEPAPGTLAHLVWRCTRPNPAERPAIGEVREFYQIWSKHAHERLDSGEVQSLKECFVDAV